MGLKGRIERVMGKANGREAWDIECRISLDGKEEMGRDVRSLSWQDD